MARLYHVRYRSSRVVAISGRSAVYGPETTAKAILYSRKKAAK